MSICDFYPMKKRRLSKTPSRRRPASTLGKLTTSNDSTSPGDAGIEVFWDNNSPSPNSIIALAARQRKRPKNRDAEEKNESSDISFMVKKLSEIKSPVVDPSHSALLEMWIGKDQNCKDGEEGFTSPPFQAIHEKRSSTLSTPLNQRRTSRRASRKTARQFMLEIRKLVDEIQKSDLSSCSNPSERKSQDAEKETERSKRLSGERNVDPATVSIKPRSSQKTETCARSTPEPGATDTERFKEDSFEWTEDDMDELILTCQLSSSGKGSLDVPEAPKPHYGFSPSVTVVAETQLVPETASKTCDEICAFPREQSPEVAVKVEDETWEVNFDEDDSLLESAAKEFELSQECLAMQKSENFSKVADGFSEFIDDNAFTSLKVHPAAEKTASGTLSKQRHSNCPFRNSSSGRVVSTSGRDFKTSSKALLRPVPSADKCRGKEQKGSSQTQRLGTSFSGIGSTSSSSFAKKSSEGQQSSSKYRLNLQVNSSTSFPLNSRPGNTSPASKAWNNTKRAIHTATRLRGQPLTVGRSSRAEACGEAGDKFLSDDKRALPVDDDSFFFSNNSAELFDDFDFEEQLIEATQQATVPLASESGEKNECSSASSSQGKKITYSHDQIEQKRLEAQRRRRAKLQGNSARASARNAMIR